MKKKYWRKLSFAFLFVVLGLIFSQVPINQIVGSKQSFTLLEFMGPTAGAFLGGMLGAVSVVVVKIVNNLISGAEWDLLTVIRLLPMALAAIYFGTTSLRKKNIPSILITLVPVLCIILFIAHPEGRQAFLFSFFWLIPIIASFRKDNLFLRSLGATFTAHAVGSTAFLYATGMDVAVWYSLVPVVLLERGFFALGIASFHTLFNTVLGRIAVVASLKELRIEPKYFLNKIYKVKHK